VENEYVKGFDFLPMSDSHWGACPTEGIKAMTSLLSERLATYDSSSAMA